MATSTISLGKIKFTWKGDWAGSTAYKKDDVVKYGPNVYVCLTAHTSTSSFADNEAKWDLMVSGLENAGTWSSVTLYKTGQTVTYGGAVYIALRENTNANPYTNAADWQKFVDGQQFEGDWNSGTDYQKGDIVSYGGYLYVCKQNSTNNNPTNTTYWDVYVKGYQETVGTQWNEAQQYKPGDTLVYGGNRYVTKEGVRPLNIRPTDTNYFEKLIDGFAWRGDWASATEYRPNDLVKYGAKVYKVINLVSGQRPDQDANFELFVDGITFIGIYSNNNSYKKGDIVTHGGRSYICVESYENDGSSTTQPANADFWSVFSDGFKWEGSWSNLTVYKINDVVEYSQSSYISIADGNQNNVPGSTPLAWELVAQGDTNAVHTTRGDIAFRDASAVTRLPIGPAGSFLTSNGNEPVWGHLTPQNDYYVSPQGDDSNDGRTATTSWKTIKHACEQTFSLGQCRINVQAGTYAEQCPIRVGRSVVLEGNGLGAVTVSPDTTNDNGFGVGISDDGSTPNANSFVFHMNNGCRMRNFVFRNFSTGSVLVSLDPGTGQDDTSVWITSQSPYVQNCTSFTPGGTGFKIDGGLHNGGYKSMVANDWTQINSDGIGIHALNDGRTEIVSCFTYYCDVGYLAESGGKIRAIVGNNSYGEYGAVARGFSQAETPLTGNFRLTSENINSITQLSSDVHVFTSYRDTTANRFFVGHTAPTGTDVSSSWDNTASYPIIYKYNSAGSLDWVYTYESSYGAIHSVVEVSDRIMCGGVIYDGGSNKAFIMAISKAGEFQWQKTVGNMTEIVDVASDGDFLYAIGTHASEGVGVVKINTAGVEQWARTLSFNDSTNANTLVPSSCAFAGTPTTSTDTYALAGDATAEDNLYVAAYDTNLNNSFIVRLSSAGVQLAGYTYGDVRINTIALDTGNGDGIYLTAGGYYNDGSVNPRPLLYRLTVDGTVQWQAQPDFGAEQGEIKDIIPQGNSVYACGYVNDNANTNNRGFVTRFTSNGTQTWNYLIENGTNNIAFNGVMLDGVNVISAGIEQGNAIINNVQRDLVNTIGTVTSGSYTLTDDNGNGSTVTFNTVVSKAINAIDVDNVTLGLTDSSLTLNQSPSQSATVVATRAGFAGIGTGVTFNIDSLSRRPKEGSVFTITGDTETYFVISVNSYDEDTDIASVSINPAIPSNKIPNDNTSCIFREAFSQVRMTGHDFLDIGTGGFADTNYPVIIASDYTQAPDQTRETLAENGGKVFYVTTDQDGNFRVGDFFKVEQSTGRATLSSEEFDLSGLNELQLGSITAGKVGATINEFSTDGTFADNSDASVPTEKAVKTYVDTQINNLSDTQGTIVAGTAPTQSKVEVTGSGQATDTIDFDINGNQIAQLGSEYLHVPVGTTANRPGSPSDGYIRYNSDLGTFEGYSNNQWSGLGGGNPWITKATGDSPYTAVNNDRIFVDTSGGAVTITLPATPSSGDRVQLIDIASNAFTNNITIGRNGESIMGLAQDMTIDENSAGLALIYSGATYGWVLEEV